MVSCGSARSRRTGLDRDPQRRFLDRDPERSRPVRPQCVSRKSAQETKRRGPGTEPELRFVPYPTSWRPEARHVLRLLEDRDGTLWGGTSAGLARLEEAGVKWQFQMLDLGVPATDSDVVTDLQDKDGALWIGAWDGLYRRWPDGRFERYTSRNGLPQKKPVRTILEITMAVSGLARARCCSCSSPDLTPNSRSSSAPSRPDRGCQTTGLKPCCSLLTEGFGSARRAGSPNYLRRARRRLETPRLWDHSRHCHAHRGS